MLNKHKVSFEFISKKILDKLNDKVKSDLYKYRRVRRKILEWESDIEGYKSEIKKKQKRINVTKNH
jgi:peptidoglycan hydrolase CwlO-like protein